ncbi:RNA polymerase factor sigma-54 [Elongatibacter sediminis]|uniref:RNA polymerase sigma-54 factor n=1 Tax=Elongatibacter sediminis TaxID=3119006 RepID=A0AAW9RNI4_9GAMM
MADQSLQLRLTQKLALAPQLQQAIRLLQLNRIELREYIQEAIESNPLLERGEGEGDGDSAQSESEASAAESEDYGETAEPGLEEWDDGFSIDEPWMTGSSGGDAFSGDSQIADDTTGSLREHLLWQINLSHFSDKDAAIATAIVFGLDEEGFLEDSIEDIRSSLAPEILTEEDEVLAVLHRVQRMEPVGVASRGPGECIRVQLAAMPGDTPGRELGTRIARDYLDLVADHDLDGLRKATGASEERLVQALQLIQSLDPRPGTRFDNRQDEYLVPDVYVTRVDDEWRVTLNPENDPGLRLNRYYIDLLRKSGGKDADYLKGRLQEARWLMSSLEMRNRTLMNVAQTIVEMQQDFLDVGEIAMRPLVLREVAEEVGVHESTVSRATTRKYMLTPRGIYELKYFFSSHVQTVNGGAISATAVKARLQMLLEHEPQDRPLSDQDLSVLLREAGVRVARRTVAKYRESLGIGSSTERRREYRRQAALKRQAEAEARLDYR